MLKKWTISFSIYKYLQIYIGTGIYTYIRGKREICQLQKKIEEILILLGFIVDCLFVGIQYLLSSLYTSKHKEETRYRHKNLFG